MLGNVLELRRVPREFGERTPREVATVVHPFTMVMTPDCDLEQDFKAWEMDGGQEGMRPVPRILLCELQEAEELRGEGSLNSAIWKQVRQNSHERYQFLTRAAAEADALGEGLPTLASDFRRVLSLPTDELYAQIACGIVERRTVVVERYLFDVVQRFYAFQGRVGLPVAHDRLEKERKA